MRLVVGLGNPGTKYAGTRHNIGFDVVNELARRQMADAPKNKFQADFVEVMIGGEKVLLVSPLTFMNCSGESVWQFIKFYQPDPADLVVICDDMNLPVGKLRWRGSGSAGGQKGLSNIIQHLGHQDFPRLRVGVGRPPGKQDVTSWVLGRFRENEREAVEHAVVRSADSIEEWCSNGLETTMNLFNRAPEED